MKKHSILFDIILALLTAGLWNIWVQRRQIRDTNTLIGEDKYSFLKWGIFSLLTFGIYHIYHEYIMTKDILSNLNNDTAELLSVGAAVCSAFGLWILVDAFHQQKFNERYVDEIKSLS
jgi:hypothetical protein